VGPQDLKQDLEIDGFGDVGADAHCPAPLDILGESLGGQSDDGRMLSTFRIRLVPAKPSMTSICTSIRVLRLRRYQTISYGFDQ
jgi:hypothetical protein